METYKFVFDKGTLRAFYDAVFDTHPLKSDDEYRLVAASSRNKGLTEEERAYYGISNKEMYKTEPIFLDGWTEFYSKICQFECNVDGFLTKLTQVPLPQKTLTLYMNLNPISIRKSFLYRFDQMSEVVKMYVRNQNNLAEGGNVADYITTLMRRCLRLPNAVVMECQARRDWVDWDVDFEDADNAPVVAKDRIKKALKDVMSGGRYVIVRSKGGLHILMPTNLFDRKTNPASIEKALRDALAGIACKEIGEVKGGVPLPGCLQREFPVTFEVVNWDGEAGA